MSLFTLFQMWTIKMGGVVAPSIHSSADSFCKAGDRFCIAMLSFDELHCIPPRAVQREINELFTEMPSKFLSKCPPQVFTQMLTPSFNPNTHQVFKKIIFWKYPPRARIQCLSERERLYWDQNCQRSPKKYRLRFVYSTIFYLCYGLIHAWSEPHLHIQNEHTSTRFL